MHDTLGSSMMTAQYDDSACAATFSRDTKTVILRDLSFHEICHWAPGSADRPFSASGSATPPSLLGICCQSKSKELKNDQSQESPSCLGSLPHCVKSFRASELKPHLTRAELLFARAYALPWSFCELAAFLPSLSAFFSSLTALVKLDI